MVWIRPTACDGRVHNHGVGFHRVTRNFKIYDESAGPIMMEGDVLFIDLYGFTLRLGEDLFCDHVHCHDHIRKQHATYIAGWLTLHCR